MRIVLILNAFFLLAPTTAAQRQRELSLIPAPSTVQLGTGQLPIDRSFSAAVTGVQDTTLERGVQRFLAQLSQQTGMPLKHKPGESTNPTLLIHADHGREPVEKLGEDESYELAITDSGAKLTAPTPWASAWTPNFLPTCRNHSGRLRGAGCHHKRPAPVRLARLAH